MNKFVIDASVVLNSLLHPSDSIDKQFHKHLKDQQQGKIKLYSIPFIYVEVANGLRFSLTDEKLARDTLKKYSKLPLEYFSMTPSHMEEALRISYQYKTTVYDSLYHVVAMLLEGTFLTCDGKYYKKAKGAGFIKLLS